MPLRSKAQARYLFATKPAMAKEWAAMTPSVKNLPEHVTQKLAKKRKETYVTPTVG